jgi:hypothetical protein
MDEPRCQQCEEPVPGHKLSKCPICHKYFCEEHSFLMSGVQFCSRGCGEFFFYGDPDD